MQIPKELGYSSRQYSESFSNLGEPVRLRESGGWLIKRPIISSGYFDAMGAYPLFQCVDWNRIGYDFQEYSNQLLCLSLVADPFGAYSVELLKDSFNHKVLPFKKHVYVDLHTPLKDSVSSHHMRNVRKGLKLLTIENPSNPMEVFEPWCMLYHDLIQRHLIRGILTFSREQFAKQFLVPGFHCFTAKLQREIVGCILFYCQGELAYYHLGAFSKKGYQNHASFALFWEALNYFFSLKVHCVNLGSGSGVAAAETDGLFRFKEGWSKKIKMSYFCGHIFDREGYSLINHQLKSFDTDYFPAYRRGEFG